MQPLAILAVAAMELIVKIADNKNGRRMFTTLPTKIFRATSTRRRSCENLLQSVTPLMLSRRLGNYVDLQALRKAVRRRGEGNHTDLSLASGRSGVEMQTTKRFGSGTAMASIAMDAQSRKPTVRRLRSMARERRRMIKGKR